MTGDNKVGKYLGSPWLGAFLAVLELIVGFAMLSFPYLLGASAVWVAGFVFVVVGFMHLLHVFTRAGERLWSALSALVFLLLGAMMLLLPLASMEIITLIIGVVLLAGGVLRLIVAFSLRRGQGRAWRFFNACVSCLLGGLVLWTWPESSLWLIGTAIAVEMVFSGWTLLFLVLTSPAEKSTC
ncbi:MAG: DUF308 domain-containing protein [Akkermansia sp.]|nr:DUF308 domain-containing protein [Akkermansia sp.]